MLPAVCSSVDLCSPSTLSGARSPRARLLRQAVATVASRARRCCRAAGADYRAALRLGDCLRTGAAVPMLISIVLCSASPSPGSLIAAGSCLFGPFGCFCFRRSGIRGMGQGCAARPLPPSIAGLARCGDLLAVRGARDRCCGLLPEYGHRVVRNFFGTRRRPAGFGLAYVPEDLVQPHLADSRLTRVLEDWCHPWSGYHLYYPSRRQHTPAFALLVEALRYRG